MSNAKVKLIMGIMDCQDEQVLKEVAYMLGTDKEPITKPEFTEEGLYEMANGETVEVIKTSMELARFASKTKPMSWDRYGYRNRTATSSEKDREATKLIRYLGKKPFSIDKPGVYETYDGKKVHIYHQNMALNWHGSLLTTPPGIREFNTNGDWYSETSGFIKGGSHSIKKYISPAWNFEKGEPV